MNIEYLSEGYSENAIIRIYGVESAPLIELISKLQELRESQINSINVHELKGFNGVNGCELTIFLCKEDKGIVSSKYPLKFEWCGTSDSMATMIELLSALTQSGNEGCYQWLCGNEARFGLPKSEIGVVISRSVDGKW